MTQTIEPCVKKKTQRMELFLKDSKNWTFPKNTIQRTEFFFNMTQRFFSISDSKNWSHFLNYDSQNEFFFWNTNTTHRTDFFFQYDLQNWTFFFWIWLFFLTLNFFLNTIQRSEILQYDSEDSTFFSDMTQSIELFLYDALWIELFFKKYDLTHRIEPLFMNLFSRWLKELKSFFLTQRIEPFLFSNVTQRIELFFSKCLKEFNLSFIWTIFTWLKELNFFFSIWIKEFFLMSQRVEPVFEYDSKNRPFFQMEYDSKNWTFQKKGQRIELFECDSKNWTFYWVWFRELNLFLSMTQKIELFSFFWIRLNESIPFFWMWLENWNFWFEK